jgi:hypothetical protein
MSVWLASQLAHLPLVRAVTLELRDIQAPYTSAGAAALASTLQQLQHLTSVRLNICAGLGREHLVPCPSLQHLSQLRSVDLQLIGTSGQPLDLGTLPSSLTAIRFEDCQVSYTHTSSSASGSAVRLPLLQELDVYMSYPDPHLQQVCLLLCQASALSKLEYNG